MCIATDKLKFLDIVNYRAPGFSYAKYLMAYNVTETKGVFCYKYIDSLDKLNETSLPPHSAFFPTLKNSNVTDEEYTLCKNVWAEKDMKTFKDILIVHDT
jgi:hypothetical protein